MEREEEGGTELHIPQMGFSQSTLGANQTPKDQCSTLSHEEIMQVCSSVNNSIYLAMVALGNKVQHLKTQCEGVSVNTFLPTSNYFIMFF